MFRKLFKQTFIYGLATVLPRMLSFLLTPLFVIFLQTGEYGEVSIIYAWFAIFNVLLAYGMETAFFRFYNKSENKAEVISTSLISIIATTLCFVVLAFSLGSWLSEVIGVKLKYFRLAIYILALDALVIVPFAFLRAQGRPIRYAVVKITNVAVNLGLNLFFLLLLPGLASSNPEGLLGAIYVQDFEISYIFIANLIASALTLIMMAGVYFRQPFVFQKALWRKMLRYALPVMIAGIAFTINEVFDRILLKEFLDADVADSKVGMYSACYKLALFMTLFATAFRLGIEPFFFSHASSENPEKAYAQITNYFVILGSVILLFVVVFADLLKLIIVPNPDYWEAMPIVPIILLASFCLGIYHNLSVWYKVTDKTRYGAFISVIGAVITIAINVVFIPLIGYYASAFATLAAYGTMMILSYLFGRKHYPIPYNFRKIVFYLGLSVFFSALSFYVFNRNLIVGSLLLFVFLGLVYKMEKDVLKRIFLKRGQT